MPPYPRRVASTSGHVLLTLWGICLLRAWHGHKGDGETLAEGRLARLWRRVLRFSETIRGLLRDTTSVYRNAWYAALCILTQLPCWWAGGRIFKELQLLNPMLGNISFGELAAGWCLSFLSLSVSPPLSSVMPPCLHALFGTGAEWMAPCQPRKTTVFIRHYASCSPPHTPSLSNSSPFFSFHPSFCRFTLDPWALFDDWVVEMISDTSCTVFTSAFTSVQRATVTFYSVFLSLLFSSDVPFISRYSKITSALLCPLWYSTSRDTQACSLGPNKLFSLLFCFLFFHSENLSMKRFATGGHCDANQVD